MPGNSALKEETVVPAPVGLPYRVIVLTSDRVRAYTAFARSITCVPVRATNWGAGIFDKILEYFNEEKKK